MTSTSASAAPPDYDWIVVGSGFGGSVAALRLVEKGYRVAVLEQGRRYADDDFPKSAWQARKLLWAPRLGLHGILRLSTFRHVGVLSGVGVGGGSLVYANTLYQPRSDDFYRHPQWRELADWRGELAPHYATARRMLGVVEYAGRGPVESLMRGLAEDLGAPEGFRRTPVGVYLGEPGRRVPDPYFGGQGPDRTGCVKCGQCMLGCRYGAKNTLVKNYLWLAERGGAQVIAERQVVDVRPIDGGYAVTSTRPGPLRRDKQTLTAAGVVFAAGALGTNELLRRCKNAGSLPGVSPRLGELVRTNSEAIPAVTAFRADTDYRSDLAITSSIFPDGQTHITNNTFGAGGNALALTFGPLTGGRSGRWRQALAGMPRHLVRLLRIRSWSRRSVVFTVMQSTESSLALRPRGRRLQTVQDVDHPVQSYLPIANRVAELAAARIDGYPQTSMVESFAGAPTSAHILGGAVIGTDPGAGVIDARHRVFGYPNLLVCDGAAVPANPGVNPSLTITALAERAMSLIPAKAPAANVPAHDVPEASAL